MVEVGEKSVETVLGNKREDSFKSKKEELSGVKTIKDRVRLVLRDFEEARNSDWRLVKLFSWFFGEGVSLTTVTRMREEVQNVDNEFLPTEEVRALRREVQAGIRHRYGGQ